MIVRGGVLMGWLDLVSDLSIVPLNVWNIIMLSNCGLEWIEVLRDDWVVAGGHIICSLVVGCARSVDHIAL